MFKVLEKTSWVDIKEDEVYAVLRSSGVFDIEARCNQGWGLVSIILSSDSWYETGHVTSCPLETQDIYKLPENVQNLFITK